MFIIDFDQVFIQWVRKLLMALNRYLSQNNYKNTRSIQKISSSKILVVTYQVDFVSFKSFWYVKPFYATGLFSLPAENIGGFLMFLVGNE